MELMDKRLYNNCRWSFINSSLLSSSSTAATITTCIILLLCLPFSSSSSDDELQVSSVSIGRNLLQAIQECPVDVQGWNYSIITDRCKGPRYPPSICCEAFKELACPYADEINDVTNNCATTMFSYINLYGNYPPGLFANICRDSRRGLECTEEQKSTVSRTTSSATTTTRTSSTIAFFSLLTILCWSFL